MLADDDTFFSTAAAGTFVLGQRVFDAPAAAETRGSRTGGEALASTWTVPQKKLAESRLAVRRASRNQTQFLLGGRHVTLATR